MNPRKIVPSVLGCAIAALICFHALPAAGAAEGSFQRTLQVNGPVHMDLTTGSGNVRGAHRQFQRGAGDGTHSSHRLVRGKC